MASVASSRKTISVDRQTHLVAAAIIWTGAFLTLTRDPLWIYLMMLPGVGLTISGLTGICPMTLILKKMPWNR